MLYTNVMCRTHNVLQSCCLKCCSKLPAAVVPRLESFWSQRRTLERQGKRWSWGSTRRQCRPNASRSPANLDPSATSKLCSHLNTDHVIINLERVKILVHINNYWFCVVPFDQYLKSCYAMIPFDYLKFKWLFFLTESKNKIKHTTFI